MSIEAAKEFLAKIAGDQALAEKVKEAGADAGEIIRLGREQGFEFTAEEMKGARDEMENLLGQGLLSFLERVAADKELAKKLEESGTDVDEIIRLGKENGCEFTADNLKALQGIMVRSDAELSDEELENVAGGIFTALAAVLGTLAAVGVTAIAIGVGAGFMIGKGSAIVAKQRG